MSGTYPAKLIDTNTGQEVSQQDLDDALRRLKYEELFVLQVALARRRLRHETEEKPHRIVVTERLDGRIRARFPFPLTGAQDRCVGEIADEFDIDEDVSVTRTEDGQFLVEGATTIRDANRAMDWSLPDDEANTIAGLVIHEAQMIPTVGQVFSFHGFRFEVTKRRGNRITELKVRPL